MPYEINKNLVIGHGVHSKNLYIQIKKDHDARCFIFQNCTVHTAHRYLLYQESSFKMCCQVLFQTRHEEHLITLRAVPELST